MVVGVWAAVVPCVTGWQVGGVGHGHGWIPPAMVVVGIVIGTIVLIIFVRTFGKYHAAVLRKQEEVSEC